MKMICRDSNVLKGMGSLNNLSDGFQIIFID